MSVFPSMTVDYIFWKMSFQQFFLWYDRAMEIKTGNPITRKKEQSDEEIIAKAKAHREREAKKNG